MTFVELPGYAEARSTGYELIDELDNGMGDTVGMVEEYLMEELEGKADELGVDYYLEPDRTDVLVSGEDSRAVLYDEFYEESRLAVMGAVIFECPSDSANGHGGVDEGTQEFRVPTNGGELFFDEENIRSAADYHRGTRND